MKTKNRSRKQSHKLDGIGVGRIRTFPFLPIPFTTPSLMIQWKLGCRSRKQKRKNQPIAKSGIEHCHWFILPLLLATPTMQFSLDRKQRRHQKNQCSASDSVGLIFTRSYRSTLLITTPTTTPSLVKTSLNIRRSRLFGQYHGRLELVLKYFPWTFSACLLLRWRPNKLQRLREKQCLNPFSQQATLKQGEGYWTFTEPGGGR